MNIFTGIGIIFVLTVLYTTFYLILYDLFDMFKSEIIRTVYAFITFAIIMSSIVAVFKINPEVFGYQKIEVSKNIDNGRTDK